MVTNWSQAATNEPDYLDLFIRDQRRQHHSEGTIRTRGGAVRRFLAYFGSLDNVTRRRLETWIASRGAPRTQRMYRDALRTFYIYAKQCRWVDDDPTIGIELASAEAPPAVAPTAAEVERAIKQAKNGQVRAWVALAAYQGLRSRDIAFLAAEDVNLSTNPRLNFVGPQATDRTLSLHDVVVVALSALDLPQRGRLFAHDSRYISQEIRRNAVALRVNANQGALLDWYHEQVRKDGLNFGRATSTDDRLPAVLDEEAIDAGLWLHIASLVDADDWGKVASQTAIYTEDRIRKWGGRPATDVGEQLMTAVFGERGPLRLGSTEGERQGWHRLAMGVSMALRNADAHRIEERKDQRRYAIGVVGVSSLLLTQVRFQYPDRVAP